MVRTLRMGLMKLSAWEISVAIDTQVHQSSSPAGQPLRCKQHFLTNLLSVFLAQVHSALNHFVASETTTCSSVINIHGNDPIQIRRRKLNQFLL